VSAGTETRWQPVGVPSEPQVQVGGESPPLHDPKKRNLFDSLLFPYTSLVRLVSRLIRLHITAVDDRLPRGYMNGARSSPLRLKGSGHEVDAPFLSSVARLPAGYLGAVSTSLLNAPGTLQIGWNPTEHLLFHLRL